MNLDDAARATRKYSVVPPILGNEYWRVIQHSDPTYTDVCFNSPYDAQAACDRMNLRAALEAIRGFGGPFAPDYEMVIDAIIEEVGK